MSNKVDLRGLAIDRSGTDQPSITTRRHVLTRYALPFTLSLGFLSLVVWASRDLIFPPTPVMVVPVFSTTAEVQREGTPLFKAAGWIEPRPTPVRVAALAPGVIEKLLVVEDQLVAAGDPIAELVKDDASLVHDRAIADLNLRLAELEEANASFKAAEIRFNHPVHLTAALSEAEASLAKCETALKNLPFEVRRANADNEARQRGYEGKASLKGVIAGVEIDIARSKAVAAEATVDELRSRATSLEKEWDALVSRRNALRTQLELLTDETEARDEARAKIKGSTARVAQAGVAVAEAKLQLDRMTIVAPVDGRVFRLFAHPGARVGSGMTQMTGHDGSTVVTMYRPDMLQVRVDVRFEDIPQVSLKQRVDINNPALQSFITGEVLFISSEADIQKNTLQVKVAIHDPPSVVRPEMLVDVMFLAPRQLEQTSEATRKVRLYVLQQLIHQTEGSSFVWLADQSEGVARRALIRTGAVGLNGFVEVISGLTVSSRIITSETGSLRDGDRIEVTSEDLSLGTKIGISSGNNTRTMNRLPTRGNE